MTVIGSSFTNANTGYPDAVRYALQRDVLDISLPVDQGPWSGMVGYLGRQLSDDWAGARLRLGGEGAAEIVIGEPTPRCIMTTLAQEDLDRQPVVLQTIARQNRRSNDLGSFACLGAYATVARPGMVRAGDEIELV